MKILLKTVAITSLLLSFSAKAQWNLTGNSLSGTLPAAPTQSLGSTNGGDLIFITTNTEKFRISTTATTTSPLLFAKAPALTSAQEFLLHLTVADATSDYFRIMNGTGATGNFYPLLVGYKTSSSLTTPALGILGSVPAISDVSPNAFDPGVGIISFSARRDFPSGGSPIVNRPLFTWSNYTTQYMTMLADGKLGIKTIKPTADLTVNGNVLIGDPFNISLPSGYKLYVETGILTEKVKVAVATSGDWADYVFAKNYKLKELAEVESYINMNAHLPGVPSANDVVKEGIDLGKMDAKLLEKIEELTLYMINQDKQLKALEQKNTELNNKLSQLLEQK